MAPSTLSQRGQELAAGPNIREKFKTILANPYDPDKNPEGFINIGTSENVNDRAYYLSISVC